MDYVPVINDVTMLAIRMGAPTGQRHQMRAADEQFQPVIEQTNPQPMTDEPGGYGVKHLAQGKAAGRGDRDDDLLEVRCPPRRKRLQNRPFDVDPLAVAGIPPADDLVNKAAIGGEVIKVAGAAQKNGIFDGLFEVAMRTLDRL